MKKITFKNKGFTLVETLLIIGVVSLSIIGVYVIFNIANSWVTSNEEATQVSNAIERINRASSSAGIYTGMNKTVLDSLGGQFNSKFNLTGIDSPTPNKLNINYSDISSRNCSSFVSKILEKGNNLATVVNGTNISSSAEISSIANACSGDSNTVVIVLTSNTSVVGLTPVVPTP
jgi:type II secretory pathway pseudopilin PulG